MASDRPTGFARLTPEERRRCAAKGGRAAHASKRAHRWTTEQAREAGRKGGLRSRAKRLAVTDGTPEVAA
jgi:general stress protein YciG